MALEQFFDDEFWHQYLGNCLKMLEGESHGCLPVNPKKYHHHSLAVITLRQYFEQLGLPVPGFTEICAILKLPFVDGDVIRAFHYIRHFQLAGEGYFLTNSPVDKLGRQIIYQGAENWENVMCYLDALLFAMFANMESFEPILFISNQHSSHQDNKLVNQLSGLLRVYTTLMRLGNLITTDLTIQLCEVLTKLGFSEATSHAQQDLAALFEFLTETLMMPFLTFKIDIKHGGKFSKDDDQKISKERVLFVLIPEDDDELTLREISPVDEYPERVMSPLLAVSPTHTLSPAALRPMSPLPTLPIGLRVASPTSVPPPVPSMSPSPNSPHSEEDSDEGEILLEECLEHYFNNSISVKRELERRATFDNMEVIEGVPVESPTLKHQESMLSISKSAPMIRTRSLTLSIWLEATSTGDDQPKLRRRATLVHTVNLPAWMFLRLLPFYTDDNDTDGTAKNSQEFVNRRPILPICLKRYEYDVGLSLALRLKRRVIIPPVISLPQFVADEDDSVGLFKLILELAVCHRGTLISSGHFIAATRRDNNNTELTLEDGYNEEWLLFDDMNKKHRIKEKTFKEIFDSEWPYMLFYRLVLDDDEPASPLPLTMPVLRPHGHKGKYWKEEKVEEMSPATLRPLSPLFRSDNRRGSQASASSIPMPAIPPTDPNFVDIRDRYYWYVADKNRNYYQELPRYNLEFGSEVTLSPQFRRNSQWSNDLVVDHKIPEISLDHNAPSKPPHEEEPHIKTTLRGEREKKGGFLRRAKLKRVHSHKQKYRDEKCIVM